MRNAVVRTFALFFLIAWNAPSVPAETTPPQANAAAQAVTVILATSRGNITLELDRARAPITVANFLSYVDQGHYDGTIFHRVIPGFMIQGGGYDSALEERETHDPIRNEATNGLPNTRGTIAMARTADPDSATAQFFINVVDNPYLDHSERGYGYTVFGHVIAGMETVDAIASTPTHSVEGFDDVPVEPVVLVSAKRAGQ